MTPFCFEHVFLAAAPADIFAAYFDPDHVREQDRALELVERQILDFSDGDEVVRTSRIVPRRQLPTLLRPFSPSRLYYTERASWRRGSSELAVDMRLLGDRGRVQARYALLQTAPGSILRRYTGHVSVDIALVPSRVERGIVAEFERSLTLSAACTQGWLDRQSQRSVAARA